jgi:outer membrane protein assembly factor BamB
MYALDAGTGDLIWKFRAGWGIKGTPIIDDRSLFFGSLDNTFYALDAKSGALKWSFTSISAIQGSPAAYGSYVFFGSDDGRLYALNKSNGNVAWSFAPSYSLNGDVYNYITTPIPSTPTVSNGLVFIGAGGQIFGLDAQTQAKTNREEITTIPSTTIVLVIIPILLLLALTLLYYRKG